MTFPIIGVDGTLLKLPNCDRCLPHLHYQHGLHQVRQKNPPNTPQANSVSGYKQIFHSSVTMTSTSLVWDSRLRSERGGRQKRSLWKPQAGCCPLKAPPPQPKATTMSWGSGTTPQALQRASGAQGSLKLIGSPFPCPNTRPLLVCDGGNLICALAKLERALYMATQVRFLCWFCIQMKTSILVYSMLLRIQVTDGKKDYSHVFLRTNL